MHPNELAVTVSFALTLYDPIEESLTSYSQGLWLCKQKGRDNNGVHTLQNEKQQTNTVSDYKSRNKW